MKKIVVRLIFLILFFDGLVAYATEETQFHIVRSGFSADGNAITDVITGKYARECDESRSVLPSYSHISCSTCLF